MKIMRILRFCVLIVTIVLCGCRTTRGVSSSVAKSNRVLADTLATGRWDVARSRAEIAVDWQGTHYEATVSMVGYRDSLVVVSYAPIFGIEAARLEANEKSLHGTIRIPKKDIKKSYLDASVMLGEKVTWKKMQEFVSGYNPFKKVNVNYLQVNKQ